MEPFGAAVSALTVLEVISKSIIYLQAVRNAPSERRDVLDQVRKMKGSLDNLQSFILEKDEECTWRKDLDQMESREGTLEQCAKAMQRLNDKLYPVEKLGIGKWWQALTWRLTKDDVKDLLSAIDRAEAGVDRMLQRANTNEILQIRNGLNKLTIDANDRELVTLLDWLCPTTYEVQVLDKLSQVQGKSGFWFLNHPAFLRWARSPGNAVLYCPGHQGSGKTVIASLVIRKLQECVPADQAVLFLYLDHKRQHEQNISHIVSTMLRQLVATRHAATPELIELRRHHQKNSTRPSYEELRDALHGMLESRRGTHIVIDALDEASDSAPRVQAQLIDLLWSLRSSHGINFLVTCRQLPHLQEYFATNSTTLSISADPADVSAYLASRQTEFPRSIQKRPEVIEKAVQSVIKVSDGMFLLARLLMDSLTDVAETPRHLTEMLTEMSLTTYETAYRSAMERITTQATRKRRQALAALMWIVRAKARLSPLSLRRALAVDVGDEELDQDRVPDIEDVLASCQGLVVIDERSDVVSLVHKTAHEYLLSNHLTWLPGADVLITQACLTYCAFATLPDEPAELNAIWNKRFLPKADDLFRYAMQYTGHHAQDVDNSADECALSTLVRVIGSTFSRKGTAWLNYTLLLPAVNFSIAWPNTSTTSWHFLARWNLRRAFRLRVGDFPLEPLPGHNGDTPLHYAACFGATEIVKMIVEAAPLQADAQNHDLCTPLSEAANSGNVGALSILLGTGKIKVDCKNRHGISALTRAVGNDHLPTVVLLLEAGSEPTTKEEHGPLFFARSPSVAIALLEAGAKVNQRDWEDGRTALHWIIAGLRALRGSYHDERTEVVRLLLQHGANPNVQDWARRSPLHLAVLHRSLDAIALLIKHQADVTLRDKANDTPLSIAATSKGFTGHRVAETMLSAMRAASSNFAGQILACHQMLLRRSREAQVHLGALQDSPATQTWDTSAFEFASETGRDELVRCAEHGITGCATLEALAPEVFEGTKPMRNRRTLAYECYASYYYSEKRAICDHCSEQFERYGLHCWQCMNGEFDLCANCVEFGQWCHDKSHHLQRFEIGVLTLDRYAPWQEFDASILHRSSALLDPPAMNQVASAPGAQVPESQL